MLSVGFGVNLSKKSSFEKIEFASSKASSRFKLSDALVSS